MSKHETVFLLFNNQMDIWFKRINDERRTMFSYDNLLKSLGAKKNIPAVGAAINLKNI